MAQLTNLTDRISHLRERRGGSSIVRGDAEEREKRQTKVRGKQKATRERKFAPDFFMFFAYALLAMALCTQLFLLIWLDLV